MFTNNNQSDKGGLALYIKNNIEVMVKLQQACTRSGIETTFADLNTPSGIITVGLVYKRSIEISTENFSIIFSLDPNIKTYIMGDFNINLLDYSSSPQIEIFLNLMIYCKFYPASGRVTDCGAESEVSGSNSWDSYF